MKKKTTYLLIFLLNSTVIFAQKLYISPFADSLSSAAIYNPFKMDSTVTSPSMLKINWYQDLLELEKKGDFEKAHKILNNRDTDPVAMYLLGKYNYYGLGVNKNKETAFSWYQKSSGLGFPLASETLGIMYYNGETKKANDSIALILLKKAFDGGVMSSASKIGFVFQKGDIVKRNLDSATFWYKKVLNTNDKYAIYNMAVIDESKRDIESTIAGYKKGAEANIDVASQRLGEIYFKGIGLKADIDKAKIWFKKGCELNNAASCNFLGIIYLKQKDSTKAYQLFKKGHELNDVQSTYNLALCLGEGIGNMVDIKQSLVFYNLVEAKLSSAQNNIGTLYERSLTGEHDFQTAIKWYEKSGEKNNTLGMLNAGRLLEIGGGNLKSDSAKAKFWYEKAANKSDTVGMYLLSRLLRHSNILSAIEWAEKLAKMGNLKGMRLAGDLNRQRADLIVIPEEKKKTTEYKIRESTKAVLYNKALKWYENAAKKGDDSSMVRLGQLFYVGKLVKKDHIQAKNWWKKAAERGNATANYNLAYLYENGLDNKKENINYKSAAEYYKEAIETKNVKPDLKKDAAFKLGNLYQYTEIKKGLEKDSKEAIKWYKVAADFNDADAMFEIGSIYEVGGPNVTVNKPEAIKWYKKAAVLGNDDAKKALKSLETR